VIAYVDSSALMRVVLQQPDRLVELTSFEERVTSRLTQAECLRALDRARLVEGMGADDLVQRAAFVHRLMRQMRRVAVSRSVLDRASAAFPLPIKVLDAIHLATALQIRDRGRDDLVFATHDRMQGSTALSLGFEVVGL
jgi:predicted nucleic acid-binding protein